VPAASNQRYVFQLVNDSPGPGPGPGPLPSGKSFESLFFTFTPERAAQESYDIIIIGTGIGGGIIAGDLFDTNSRLGEKAKSVLVIERGDLPFHSHCLNASRPTGFGEDRGQQNDTFFALFRENYAFTKSNDLWKGGPMFNLGGRSAAWGLFAPRIHDDTLKAQFAPDSQLYDELVRTWYVEAETVMNLQFPVTATIHQDLMERLNMRNQRGCQWQWGRIASEFREMKNFDFALGAYSTIDKLLEIAMSKVRNPDGTLNEHPNFKIILRSEVRTITWAKNDFYQATGVVVRGPDGKEHTISLKTDKDGKYPTSSNIILAAGSVASPAILMRSKKTDFLTGNNGLHLTDHDIFAKAYTFRYLNPADRDRIGAMKLQTYVRLTKSKSLALANMSIDASSFLPREFLPNRFFRNDSFPKLIAAFIRPTPLHKQNTITLDPTTQDPIVTSNRYPPFSNSNADVKELQDLTREAIEVVQEAISIDVLGTDADDEDTYFKPLELGGVAHELGTIPMPTGKDANGNDQGYCVEDSLKLRDHKGIYVCDLSVFPYSPEVNPSVTLAALALRLSRQELLPRLPDITTTVDTIYVVNQTGENIRVFVSNSAGVPLTSKDVVETLTPGQLTTRDRKRKVPESVMVYRLDYNSDTKYLPEPQLYVATPGKILAI
jgi:choline dehydrogenase-like flavoprotein